MALDLTVWKQQAADKLRGAGGWLRERMTRDAPYVAYGSLCGLSVWPLVQAAQGGDLGSAASALAGIGANAGISLIANNFQKWKDEADAANSIAGQVQEDASLRKDLDKILNTLEITKHAQAGLSQPDREALVALLRDEAKQLNSKVKIVQIKTSGGAVIGKKAKVKAGRDFAGRDIKKKTVNKTVRGGVVVSESSNVTVNQRVINAVSKTTSGAARKRYLQAPADKVNELPLRVFNPNESHSRARAEEISLCNVYIALNTTATVEKVASGRSKRGGD